MRPLSPLLYPLPPSTLFRGRRHGPEGPEGYGPVRGKSLETWESDMLERFDFVSRGKEVLIPLAAMPPRRDDTNFGGRLL